MAKLSWRVQMVTCAGVTEPAVMLYRDGEAVEGFGPSDRDEHGRVVTTWRDSWLRVLEYATDATARLGGDHDFERAGKGGREL